ncbi:uncharacterized protein METZ01_LOCUS390944, partial [marine metagenome]
GWQVFMNMFILGWVGIAMGKVCNMIFGWELWVGLVTFTALGAIYVLLSGYWGVVMADFQQGVIALLVIIIVSIWGVIAAGGPSEIIGRLKDYNSTVEWKTPDTNNATAVVRLRDPDSGKILVESAPFIISSMVDAAKIKTDEKQVHKLVKSKVANDELQILFPTEDDTLKADYGYQIVWTSGRTGKHVNVDMSSDDGQNWSSIAVNHFDGQSWRLNMFSFTGTFDGQFPVAWFVTMMIIALIGGFGMGTSIDWYPEAQRIQSAKTVRDASYSIWAGSALVLIRNSIWAAA